MTRTCRAENRFVSFFRYVAIRIAARRRPQRRGGPRSTTTIARQTCKCPGCGQPAAPAAGTGRPPEYCAGRGHTRVSAWRERRRLAAEQRAATADQLRAQAAARAAQAETERVRADAEKATGELRAEAARERDELRADLRARAERAELQADAYRDELGQLRAASSADGTGTPPAGTARRAARVPAT